MDGNGRWAKQRFLPRVMGHKQGVTALRHCVSACVQRGIAHVTVFAFSSENWRRPDDEVNGLMELMLQALAKEGPKLSAQGVQLSFIGDKTGLSPVVLQALEAAEQQSQAHLAANAGTRRMLLTVAFNYGGRWDIVHAVQSLIQQGHTADELTEDLLSQYLSQSAGPDPDLLIRTGGEQRISNFLLWQLAYSELYFSECLWPDFDEHELDKALADYAGRQRRFGRVSEQVEAE